MPLDKFSELPASQSPQNTAPPQGLTSVHMDRFGNVFHSMASNEEPDSDEDYERACEEEDAKMEEWVKSRDFEKHEAEWRASKVRERIAAEQDLYFRHLDCDLNRQKYMRQHERGDDTESVQFDPRPYDELDVLESEYFEQVNVAESSLKVQQGMHDFFMELFEVALDSGSGEHVVDGSTVPAYKVEESPGSRAGQHFITANNAKIRIRGRSSSSCGTGLRRAREATRSGAHSRWPASPGHCGASARSVTRGSRCGSPRRTRRSSPLKAARSVASSAKEGCMWRNCT